MPDEELNPLIHLMKFIRVKTGIFCVRCDIALLKKQRFTLQNTVNSTDEKSHICMSYIYV